MRHARGAVWPVARWAAGRRRRGAAALRGYGGIRACDTPEFPIGTPGALINKLPVLGSQIGIKKASVEQGVRFDGLLACLRTDVVMAAKSIFVCHARRCPLAGW